MRAHISTMGRTEVEHTAFGLYYMYSFYIILSDREVVFYVVTYYIKVVTTSWTYSKLGQDFLNRPYV